MKNFKKYKIMKIILLLNPIPITVLFLWIVTIFLTQIKALRRRITLSLRLKTSSIGFVYVVLLGISGGLINSITELDILKYILMKCIDIIIGYPYIIFLKKHDLFNTITT